MASCLLIKTHVKSRDNEFRGPISVTIREMFRQLNWANLGSRVRCDTCMRYKMEWRLYFKWNWESPRKVVVDRFIIMIRPYLCEPAGQWQRQIAPTHNQSTKLAPFTSMVPIATKYCWRPPYLTGIGCMQGGQGRVIFLILLSAAGYAYYTYVQKTINEMMVTSKIN